MKKCDSIYNTKDLKILFKNRNPKAPILKSGSPKNPPLLKGDLFNQHNKSINL